MNETSSFSHQVIGQTFIAKWRKTPTEVDVDSLRDSFLEEQRKQGIPLVYIGLIDVSSPPPRAVRARIVNLVDTFYDKITAGYFVPVGSPLKAAILRSAFATMLLLSPKIGKKFFVRTALLDALTDAKGSLGGVSPGEALAKIS